MAATALNQDIALLQRLDTPFPKPASFSDATAGDVMKAIRACAKSSIEFDSRAVGESGGWEAIRLSCEPATIRQALDAVIRAISPEYESYAVDVAAGVIVVTDEKNLGRPLQSRQKPCRNHTEYRQRAESQSLNSGQRHELTLRHASRRKRPAGSERMTLR